MNIQDAKIEIENTLRAYHLRDEEGNYRIPVVHQRPILLMGPPGIGKTAILEQIARETGAGLVAYTLTHHTRQSAVGLPHIESRTYGGRSFSVTEYTMSEIVASVYDYMEKTGKQEGILFLDEVNCVSETLAPTMLQLLQNKTFGTHRIPEGWILVAAGNPPEYNKSVRELDVATLDRVRTITVEPDCPAWLGYAREKQVHGAILSYLTIHSDRFYRVEDRAQGRAFVTARGWEDLSRLLGGYEALGVPVTEELIFQFLRHRETAGEFYACYQLYEKYQRDYDIPGILAGADWQDQKVMAEKAGFEERFLVIGLLLDGLQERFHLWQKERQRLLTLRQALHRLKRSWQEGPGAEADRMEKSLAVRREAGLVSSSEESLQKAAVRDLRDLDLMLKKGHIREPEPGIEIISQTFGAMAEAFRQEVERLKEMLHRVFLFAEDCFGEGQELVLLVTELGRSPNAMEFIGENGSEDFLDKGRVLQCRRQEKDLQAQCRALLDRENQ